ncbi:MAG: hypothetical protein GDA36_04610 [Rhodobacteraceae bacterium]|nr:hypothetical protein [Paracoccaceae bacterium]
MHDGSGLYPNGNTALISLRERVMFGGSVDLAILSGPLALHRAKRFWSV